MAADVDTIDSLFERYGNVYRWLVTLTVMIGAIAMGFATSMVNVAVPAVMGAYGVGLDQAQWMATGFLATMSTTMLLSSWLIEVLGQRVTYFLTMLVFAIGSLISATAPNIDLLVIGRVLQGAATGVGQPLAMFSIFSVFPPERRGMAVGLYGLGTVLAPTFGPILGGLAIDHISWRYLFFLPLPFCLPAMLMCLIFMPTKKLARKLPPFDWTGFLLMFVATFLLLAGLSNGQRWGWDSDAVVLRLVGGSALMAIFVWWETKAEYPFLDLTLFRDKQFALIMLAGFVFGAGLFASGYFIPVFVQSIQNYSATDAGLLLAPGGLIMMIFFPLAGRITDSFPAHIPISTGLLIFAIGFFLISVIDVNTGFWALVGYTAINRVGLSLAIPSLSAGALKAVPSEKLARGASSATFFRNLGGGFGITLLTAFFEHRAQFHSEALTATQTSANRTTFELLGLVERLLGEFGMPDLAQSSGALNYLSTVIQAQASTLGFQDTFLMIAAVALVATGPAWMIGQAGKDRRN
ncbi:MAG: DHA2 family efflux MFS transporter permease subunit [Pseudomonadota bacterium]|nr:DHA2 family efflux MFS transporter permease subunit [Pseudomonadota bacterium]